MKNQILFFAMTFLTIGKITCQISQSTPSVETITPGGIFDKVYDRFGSEYSLADLNTRSSKPIGGSNIVASVPTQSCNAGYFDLYFAPGSLVATNTLASSVLCQVFSDISSFIGSALSTTPGVGPRLNIYCGNSSPSLLGEASSFYYLPQNPTNPNQGFIDGVIYQGIITGLDPYVTLPVTFTGFPGGFTGFYHGFVNINPNGTTGTMTTTWNYALNTAPAFNQYDLYQVVLHEVSHALGISSLISSSGFSGIGPNNNYYSRFDKFLYNYAGVPLLTNSGGCATSSLTFNSSLGLSAINPSVCPGPGLDISNCSAAAQYSSANVNVKVYTPDCWTDKSSLSHFEDMCSTTTFTPQAPIGCTPTPSSPGANNLYFVMSNINVPGACYLKRHLKEEERLVLCDLGYSVSPIYSSIAGAVISGTSNTHNYSTSCGPIVIYGLNDGIVNSTYNYTTTGTTISIPTTTILQNDFPTTGLSVSCVEVIYYNTNTNVTATVTGGNLVVTATQGSGLALIKYVPVDGFGNYGNATYVYVYFLSSNCNPSNMCNMVQNGGFENTIGSLSCGVMSIQAGPILSCWENHEGNPAVVSRSCSTGSIYNLNVNTVGSSPVVMNSFNGVGNDKVVALSYSSLYPNNTQVIKNNLSAQLQANNVYKISLFAANVTSSLTGNNTINHPVVITVASSTVFPFISSPTFPSGLNVVAQFTIPAGNTWTQVSQTFTFTSPGSLSHSALLVGINATATIAQGTLTPPNKVVCYLDEIILVPIPSPSLTLASAVICGNGSISNLDVFSSNPSIGTFSGTGVSFNGSQYGFNTPPALLSPGSYPIAYTYSSGPCYQTLYDFITVSSNTNILALDPLTLCSPPYTVDLTTLITNTNFIAGTSFSVNGVVPAASPQYTFPSQGVYTITAINTSTSLNLCSYNEVATTVTISTAPSPTTILLNGNPSTSATLCSGAVLNMAIFSTAANNLWEPGSLVGISQTVAPIVSTVYTVTAYDVIVCPTSQTVNITVLSLNPTALCITNPTLNLNSLLTNTVFIGTGTFAVYNSTYTNSSPGAPFTFPGVGNYTVSFNHPSCTSNATTVVNIYSSPATPTISVNSNTLCSGTTVTLNISTPSVAASYSLTPANSSFGSVSSLVYTFNPTSSGSYSLIASNAPCALVTSNGLSVTVDPAYCLCNLACINFLSGTLTTSPSPFQTYCVTNDLYISGVVTFSNSDFKISPGVTITVANGGTLNILGSHLFACQNMWQGIEVAGSGALNIQSSSLGYTSLIEDAIVAVNVKSLTAPIHPFAGISGDRILFVDQVTFNRNQIGIKIDNFAMNTGTNNACEIKNSLFTSRSIPSYSITWPATNVIKNSSSGATSALQTPWINNALYPAVKLKAPFGDDYPTNGLVIDNTGNTSLNGTVSVASYTGMVIGEAGASNFNMFDNLNNGITLYRTNAKIINSVFQNPRGICRNFYVEPPTCDLGGTGIVANSPWSDDFPIRRSLEILPAVSGGTSYPNYFYNMTEAINVYNYLYSDVSRNKIYSHTNSYPQAPWYSVATAPPNFGNIGIKLTANSFQTLTVNENELFNIRNNILFTVTEGGTDFTTNSTFGRYIGEAYITNNYMALHPSTPNGYEYINIGISLEDPISAPGYTPNIATIAAVTPSISISTNTIVSAHNGININSFYGTPVDVRSNVISIENEPTTLFAAPIQNGINVNQTQSARLHANSIVGPTPGSTQFIRSVYMSMNTLLSIRCNETKTAAVGFHFNHAQTVSRFEDNSMEDEYYAGLLLDNAAKFTASTGTAAVGSSTWATNNTWLGSNWSNSNLSFPMRTYTEGGATAQNAKLYIQYSGNYDPDGNGGTILNLYQDNYYHTGGTNITLLPATTTLTGCRLGLNGDWWRLSSEYGKWNDVDRNIIVFMKELVEDGNFDPADMSDTSYIEKTMVYRTLKRAPEIIDEDATATLEDFYNGTSGSSIQIFCEAEENLAACNYTAAEDLLSAVTAVKDIETNYLNYYTLYIKSKTTGLSAAEREALGTLAALCPYTAGPIVYQARALYNAEFNVYKTFPEDCVLGEGERKNFVPLEKNKPQVILKSELFPNPNDGNFSLRFNTQRQKQSVEITIFNLLGKSVWKEERSVMENNEINLKCNLLNGTYLVKILFTDGTYDLHKLIYSR